MPAIQVLSALPAPSCLTDRNTRACAANDPLGSFSASGEHTTHQVVNIDAGENLSIGAGRDIVGEGTQLSAGGSAQLQAGQDINLTGANIIADGNISLHAERDTNILSVTDSEHHYLYERDDKSFGRSETTISETLQESAAGGILQAGGSVLINTQVGEDGLITLDSGPGSSWKCTTRCPLPRPGLPHSSVFCRNNGAAIV